MCGRGRVATLRGTSSLATARSKVWLIRSGWMGEPSVLGEHAAVVAALAGGHALFELAAAVAVPTRRRSGGPGRCCGGWWGS